MIFIIFMGWIAAVSIKVISSEFRGIMPALTAFSLHISVVIGLIILLFSLMERRRIVLTEDGIERVFTFFDRYMPLLLTLGRSRTAERIRWSEIESLKAKNYPSSSESFFVVSSNGRHISFSVLDIETPGQLAQYIEEKTGKKFEKSPAFEII